MSTTQLHKYCYHAGNLTSEQVKVKGKLKAVGVFEVFDGDEPKIKECKLARKGIFEEGLFFYHQHFSKKQQNGLQMS